MRVQGLEKSSPAALALVGSPLLRPEEPRSIVLRALNVDRDEYPIVRALFFHYFFQGVGLAFLTIIATASFLHAFPVSKLPVVYMASALVLFLTGRAYAILEHRLAVERLFPVVGLIVAGLAVAGWIGLTLTHAGWWIFTLMVLHRVVYLLVNLEFWGLSAILFDVRQSKRLFGLISAGDVPAKLLGYLSVSALAPVMGTGNLLGLGAASFAVSFFCLRWTVRNADLRATRGGHEHEEERPKKRALRLIFGSDFVLALALLSAVALFTLTTIDFGFLAELKYKFKKDVEFAAFLGMFFAIGQGLTIFLKLFLSGRIVDRLGVRRSMLLLPVALLLIGLALMVESVVWGEKMAVFWFFGIMVLTSRVLQYVLNGPVFLAMFQPLDRHDRLHGHTVVKGLTDPISLGVAGAVLYALLQLTGGKNLPLDLLNYLLLGSMVAWIAAVLWVYPKYLRVLREAVHNRLLDGSQLQVADRRSIEILEHRLASEYPEEVIHALELMHDAQHERFPGIVVDLLDHPVDEVVHHAGSWVEKLELAEAEHKLRELIDRSDSATVVEAAVRALCRLPGAELNEVFAHLESDDRARRAGAISGLLSYGGIEGIVSAGQALLEMIRSEDANERAFAASTLGRLGLVGLHRPLRTLLGDPSLEVRRQAIRAAGKVKSVRLLPDLLSSLSDPEVRREGTHALVACGPAAVEELRGHYGTLAGVSIEQRRSLIEICRRVASAEARDLLIKWSASDRAEDRDACYRALQSNRFHEPESGHWSRRLEEAADEALVDRVALTVVGRHEGFEVLESALGEELRVVESRLFALMSFLYDPGALNQAQQGLTSSDRERRANALEVLDNLLPKELSHRLFAILEASRHHVSEAAAARHFESAEQVVGFVLQQGQARYARWTLAVAIDAVRRLEKERHLHAVVPFVEDEEPVLHQTAAHLFHEAGAVAAVQTGRKMQERMEAIMDSHEETGTKLLEIEKVLILKGSPLFAETPNDILVDVARIVREERVAKGEEIFARNDVGDAMYIVYEGQVRITQGEKTLRMIGRRDIFGELALLDPEPRSATATAETDCLLLRLDQEPFYELMNERIEVGRGILKVLCRRLRSPTVPHRSS